jgi:hypothetical protein
MIAALYYYFQEHNPMSKHSDGNKGPIHEDMQGPASDFAPVNLLGDEDVGAEDEPDDRKISGSVSVGKQSGDFIVAVVWVVVIGLMLYYIMLGG